MGEVGAMAKGGRTGQYRHTSLWKKWPASTRPQFSTDENKRRRRHIRGVHPSAGRQDRRQATRTLSWHELQHRDRGREWDPWDLSKKDVQERCMAKVIKEKPGPLIGSPMCRGWSQIMNINCPRMSREERDARMKEAREHFQFVCTLYRLQHDEGRYFAHEHPQGAGSWTQCRRRRKARSCRCSSRRRS